jgi:hypothetical protein
MLSYDEWLKQKRDEQSRLAKEAYDSALGASESLYANALAGADATYKAAETAAGTALGQNQTFVEDAYRRDLATYGRKAEALAQSGLTGSGYSDNLARDAYASRQQGMSEAQLAYSKALTDAASAKELAIGAAEDKKIAADYTADAAYRSALADIDQRNAENSLTRAEVLDLVNSVDTSAPDEVEKALLAGVITAEEANSYRDAWNSAINPESAFTVNGAEMTKADAYALLRAYKTSPWADATKVAALEAKYREIYEGDTSAGWRAAPGFTNISRGYHIQVRNDQGEKRTMTAGPAVSDTAVVRAASNLANGAVFTYGGNEYIKDSDKVYVLRPYNLSAGYDINRFSVAGS